MFSSTVLEESKARIGAKVETTRPAAFWTAISNCKPQFFPLIVVDMIFESAGGDIIILMLDLPVLVLPSVDHILYTVAVIITPCQQRYLLHQLTSSLATGVSLTCRLIKMMHGNWNLVTPCGPLPQPRFVTKVSNLILSGPLVLTFQWVKVLCRFLVRSTTARKLKRDTIRSVLIVNLTRR